MTWLSQSYGICYKYILCKPQILSGRVIELTIITVYLNEFERQPVDGGDM